MRERCHDRTPIRLNFKDLNSNNRSAIERVRMMGIGASLRVRPHRCLAAGEAPQVGQLFNEFVILLMAQHKYDDTFSNNCPTCGSP